MLPEASAPNSQQAPPPSPSSSGISTVGELGPLALPPAVPVVKLLDFGLSKLIDPKGGGSSAKTFVGTRAYLAPEVELLAHGQGRDYGCPADCWSMGAVLHVMLVAKFPEFDVVRARARHAGFWGHVFPSCLDWIWSRSVVACPSFRFGPGRVACLRACVLTRP